MTEYIITAEDLSRKKSQLVEDLALYLEKKLPRYISLSIEGGFNILVSSERNFSKREIRHLIRKYLHKRALKKELKVIAGEKDEYIIKTRKGVELEIEEEPELEEF